MHVADAEEAGVGRLQDAAARLLRANWREGLTPVGIPFGYTRPDPVKYPDQFLWDSCLSAVAWSHIDPSRARRELRTLLAAQQPDGLIGHTIFWDGPVRLARAAGYNLLHRRDRSTATIQPPLIAWAWAEVAERSPDDPGFRLEGIAALRRYHRWLEVERADGDDLLGILQPDESGLDATPAYDGPLGWRAHPYPGFLALLRFNRRRRFSYRRVVADGGFHAIDPLVNAAWALAWDGMARLGEPGARQRSARVVAAMVDRLWHEEDGIFHPIGPDGTRLRVSTWAGLSPLIVPCLPLTIARRLVDEHVLDPLRPPLSDPERERRGGELPSSAHRVADPALLEGAQLALLHPLRARRSAARRPDGRGARARRSHRRPRFARGVSGVLRSADGDRNGRTGLLGQRNRPGLLPAGGPTVTACNRRATAE